jgi:uncharacterized protein
MFDRLAAFFSAHEELTTAYLFGSLAEGRARPDSDADFAIAGKDYLSYESLLRISEELESVTGRESQVRDLRRLQGTILSQILSKGRLLKNTDPALLERLYLQNVEFNEDISLPFLDIRLNRLEEFFDGSRTDNG